MPDCNSPKCHEHFTTEMADKVPWEKFNKLRDCVAKKTPKSWLWFGFLMLGLPLLATGIKVWAETEHSDTKYVTRMEMSEHISDITTCKESTKHLSRTLDNIQAGQEENSKDIKEILRYMRNK